MRARDTATAVLVAGLLALVLVAAQTAPVPAGAGTASTRLLGAQARVTGPVATPTVRLMDVTSSATTEGTPLAVTSVVPIAVDDTTVGETGASSSDDTSAASDGGTFGDLAGPLGVIASPVETTATATADRALATVGASTGQLAALFGQLGLDIDTTGVTSLATREGAAATQGLEVSGLSLALADLGLTADLLGQLGLDTVLALLAVLPGVLPADLADVTDVFALLEDLDAALAILTDTAAPLQASIAQLTAVEGALPDVVVLDGLLASLEGLDTGDLPTLVIDLLALSVALGDVGCPLPGGLDVTNVLQAVADAIDCVAAQLVTISSDLADAGVVGLTGDPATLLDELTSIADTLTALLPSQLDAVVAQLDALVTLVQQILTDVADLDDLLAQLPDLLAGAAGLALLDVGAFDVGTSAVAGGTLADSSASVLCEAVSVSVLGQDLSTPDCSDALDQLPDVTGAISDAVDQLTGVLDALPLGDAVEVGEFRADLFTDVVEQVSESDGVITATAGFTLLDLAVPSITLDPSQVTDVLAGLGLPDVVTPVEDLLGQVETGLGDLDALGVPGAAGLLSQVSGLLADVGAPDGLTDLVDQVGVLVDGLEVGDLGSLAEPVATPGLELLIDPVSTASFIAAPAPTPPAPAPPPAPTPTPTPQPSLPSTGGGLALLGVLALAGAGALRRRD